VRSLGIFIGLMAFAQGFEGAKLIALGGSSYYLISAMVMLAGAVLLWRRNKRARLSFHLLLLGTVAWALWETDGAVWGMLARVGFFLVLWLLVLWVTRVPSVPSTVPATHPRGAAGLAFLWSYAERDTLLAADTNHACQCSQA